jgi:hypothetical protein
LGAGTVVAAMTGFSPLVEQSLVEQSLVEQL